MNGEATVFVYRMIKAVEFRDWLLQQSEDEPIILHGFYNASGLPSVSFVPWSSVRKIQREFAAVATAHERTIRFSQSSEKKPEP